MDTVDADDARQILIFRLEARTKRRYGKDFERIYITNSDDGEVVILGDTATESLIPIEIYRLGGSPLGFCRVEFRVKQDNKVLKPAYPSRFRAESAAARLAQEQSVAFGKDEDAFYVVKAFVSDPFTKKDTDAEKDEPKPDVTT